MTERTLTTQCCISGGGPAGIMLGFLLARAGIDVVVLEKWPDFFRDFRGDTIHPSIMEILHELGLLEEFLKLPHDEIRQVEADIGTERVILADFSHLKVQCPFLGFIPQWDFLNFISGKAKQYPAFHLLMETEATDLIKDASGRIVGVRAKSTVSMANTSAESTTKDNGMDKGADKEEQREIEIRAELVVGADGRHSTIREKSGLVADELGAPIDVLWFRISRKESDPAMVLGKVDLGRMMIMIDRDDYWQCGFVIRKGDFDVTKQKGIESFRQDIVALAPVLADRVTEIKEWDQVKLLTVAVDRLPKWYLPGLLLIGDSAHAMSPIGGVGINVAIQDAVAAANVLVPAFLRNGQKSEVGLSTGANAKADAKRDTKPAILESDLAAIQKRRELPVKIIQRVQVFIQNRVIGRVLGNRAHITSLPWQIKLIKKFPYLRRIPAYFIGIGFRPEHVEAQSKAQSVKIVSSKI